MKILLIEDEPKVAAFIKKGLEEQFHNVTLVYDGSMGSKLALEQDFELIILDVVLPQINGFEVCRQIRQFKKEVPILMLSALGTVNDKVQGLENGADDYLTKPFHFEELLARIKALDRRRSMVLPGTVYQVADLQMDCFRKTVTRGGNMITLTVKEFTLLEVLMYNKNRVLSRVYIAESVWGINFNRGTNLIDVYINYLRTKIDKGYTKQLIHTVIGMGYMIRD
ncbi:response regulator transcription factor [Mucilaginibacter sp. X4EP1]|jgi:two-component system, OmpR family, copper resistance phosphate regulon response regulator CusR|uniref:response regulator transcription factor n=1 Tax=Mucilaginibacter sp. X4EP1 TaxID=2723092 RepID=UPI00216A113D|nr:response regulator transcription factor [Mucilaginibacter sp. X4EP1]MCS3812405.1 DNA-binding response OmpR family regulator [Mucilaginibacter sp. X4EP1]